MKILSWNCAGAFRNKIKPILEFDADVYVIQESEHPDKFLTGSPIESFNYLWKGNDRNKGLAVYTKPEIKISQMNVDETYRGRQLKWFLPVKVDNQIELIAVWTHKANSETFPYIGQFYWFLYNNLQRFNRPIFIGDFNSNSIWDAWDRWWNHSDIVGMLEKENIFSIYHHLAEQKQGLESIKTFYHRKDLNRGYHIDFIFAHQNYAENTSSMDFGSIEHWIAFSDHIPLIWSFDQTKM